jgi:hypothetical protein
MLVTIDQPIRHHITEDSNHQIKKKLSAVPESYSRLTLIMKKYEFLSRLISIYGIPF